MDNLQNRQLKKIGETLFAGFITGGLAIGLFTVPYLNAVILVFLPVAAIYVGVKNGPPYGVFAMAIGAVGASLILGYHLTICTFAYYGIMTLSLTACMYKRQPPYFSLTCAWLFTLAGVLLIMGFIQAEFGITVMEAIDGLIAQSMEMTEEMYEAMSNPGMTQSQLTEQMENVFSVVQQLMPSVICVLSVLIIYINQNIVGKRLNKNNIRVPMLPPFKEFSLPRSAVIGSVTIYVLAYLLGNLKIIDVSLILLNIQTILLFAFMIQGLAAVLYLIAYRNIGPFLRTTIVFALIFFLLGKYILFMIGLFDLCFDTRKRLR